MGSDDFDVKRMPGGLVRVIDRRTGEIAVWVQEDKRFTVVRPAGGY